jgi:hypothetical protein
MRCGQQAMVLIWQPVGRFVSEVASIQAVDRLLQGPVAKNWVTNGRNLTKSAQIDAANMEQLKEAWRARFKHPGLGQSIRPRRLRSSGTRSCTWLQATTMSLP